MTFADPTQTTAAPAVAAPATPVRVRDIRLDFFRGLAMFIILIAHTPGNFLTSWIPARWGFSDATEIFVFCSGMASAIAFGRAFETAGWRMGTARVTFRIWQVYWAHVGLFFATLALVSFLTGLEWEGTRNYLGQLNLWRFYVETDTGTVTDLILRFMTLRYVPNYFDILPMYMVVLVMMPIIMALARINLWLVFGFMVVTWLFGQTDLVRALGLPHLELPADPSSDRTWFFNPFGWQLIFFTGFAFMRGWIPKPPVNGVLIGIALFLVLANVPLSNIGVREFGFEWARDWRSANQAWITKSDFGILRYVHFLALAYLCWVLAGDKGDRIRAGGSPLGRVWDRILQIILKVGQQSLAVFVMSMFTARIMGFAMDVLGRDTVTVLLVNLAGGCVLILTAYVTGWFKSNPWKKVAV
jgi:hypothetical protein